MLAQTHESPDQFIQPVITNQPRLSIPLWLITLGMLILMAAIFWGTLGIRTTGLVEEWQIYRTFDIKGASLTVPTYPPQPDRPFLTLAYAIGYVLTPNSFTGLQILNMLVFIGSGMALYGLVRQLLPNSSTVAFIAATLFVVYPADNSLFNLRDCTYNFVVLLYLVSVDLFLLYWRHPSWLFIVGLSGALFLCLGIVEAAYPLVFLTPLLLIATNKGFSRRMIRVAALWYPIPVGMLAFTIYALSTTKGTYQATLFDSGTEASVTRILNYITYEMHAYTRIFIDGWTGIVHQISLYAISYFTRASLLILIIVFVGLLLTLWIMRQNPIANQSPGPMSLRSGLYRVIYGRRSSLTLFVIGLVATGLGFLPYVPTSYHDATDRVYLFASIGGAICMSLVLYGIAALMRRIKAPLLAVLFALTLGLAGVGAIGRAVGLRYDSGQVQLGLAQFAQQVPKVPDGTVILIFDRSEILQSLLWRFGTAGSSAFMEAAVQYLYHQTSIELRLCYPNRGVWGTGEECLLRNDGVQLTAYAYTTVIPYDKIIAFDYQPNYGFKLLTTLPSEFQTAQNAKAFMTYSPYSLINSQAPLPARIFTLLADWPYAPFMPHSLVVQRSIAFNLNDINSANADTVQFPFLSDGWSGSWTMATTASLHVLLAQDNNYTLHFHVTAAMLPEILNSTAFSVNGQMIPLTRVNDAAGGVTFTGTIPQAAVNINPTDTLLEFHTDKVVTPKSIGMNDDTRTLGINVDWLHIDPSDTAKS